VEPVNRSWDAVLHKPERPGEPVPKPTEWILSIDGARVAAVWFLGGHVERPDAWHVTFRASKHESISGFETMRDAQRFAEEELGLPQVVETDEIVMYLVARKDLKMSPGKLAAQCGHAVHYLINMMDASPVARWDGRDWGNQWRDSKSHAKIVLSVSSEEELLELHQTLGPTRSVLVIDEGRTEVAGKTKTALGVLPMPKSYARQFVGDLPLYR
jgi:PTH2 family peptidyl-tRNA hydrolase